MVIAMILELQGLPMSLARGVDARQPASASEPVVMRDQVLEETFAIASGGLANPWEDVDLTVAVTPPSQKPFRVGGFYTAGP